MSSCNVYVNSFVYAEHFPSINLVVLLILGWPFYNFKSSKPNKSASLLRRRNRKTFSYLWAFVIATHSALAMAGPYACRSSCRNPPPAGKDELAQATPRALTNDSGTSSYTFAVPYVPTPTPASSFAPAELVAKYTNADLQRATKLTIELFV